MCSDSNAAVVNFFSFHGFRGFLRGNESDLFLHLHILDCGNAISCMYRNFDVCASPYGNERCRLPTIAGRALCVAFQPLYYLADDPKICPDTLKMEIITFAQHCLCVEHGESRSNVHGLADRLFTAVQQWQGKRVFKDDLDGTSIAPQYERPGTARLSQFFVRLPVRSPSRSPRARPKLTSRAIDSEPKDDSWGIPNQMTPQNTPRSSLRRLSSSSQLYQSILNDSEPFVMPGHGERPASSRRSHYQQFKGRAKSMIDKVARKTS